MASLKSDERMKDECKNVGDERLSTNGPRASLPDLDSLEFEFAEKISE